MTQSFIKNWHHARKSTQKLFNITKNCQNKHLFSNMCVTGTKPALPKVTQKSKRSLVYIMNKQISQTIFYHHPMLVFCSIVDTSFFVFLLWITGSVSHTKNKNNQFSCCFLLLSSFNRNWYWILEWKSLKTLNVLFRYEVT